MHTKGISSRRLHLIDAAGRLEPLVFGIDKGDQRDGGIEETGGGVRKVAEIGIRFGHIGNDRAQDLKPLG